jgi:hypothetical protein
MGRAYAVATACSLCPAQFGPGVVNARVSTAWRSASSASCGERARRR